MALAESQQLDLVEVSPTAVPPVCRIMDYGKFKYQQSKKQQEAKKKQVQVELKAQPAVARPMPTKFSQELADIAIVEVRQKMEGRSMFMIVAPKVKVK